MNHPDHLERILILGAGTFGLSAAYHLAAAGYKSITVLEKSTSVPPCESAGNDINKIVRAEYEDPFYSKLAIEAIEAWKTPMFAPYFQQVGCIWSCSEAASPAAKLSLQNTLSTIEGHPLFHGKITHLRSREDIRRVAPVFNGPMRWTGYLNSIAGYAKAAGVLRALYAECCSLGVQIHGGDGVKNLVYDDNRCVGAVTQTGRTYEADIVIVALGASVVEILPEIRKQVVAKAWPIAHIQLSRKEAQALKGIPITCAWDIGFFTEPEPDTNLMKLCPATAGYTNMDASGLSVPLKQNDFIPAPEQAKLRHLLRETLPELSDRPFVHPKMCWCAETADTDFLIDFVPGRRCLVVISGDSGHAFKMLPLIGSWIQTLITSNKQDIIRWRWKEESFSVGDTGWRQGDVKDIKNI